LPSPRDELAIFVWEPPTELGVALVMDHYRPYGRGAQTAEGLQNSGAHYLSEWVFLHRLMADPTIRVAAPEAANLFVVPTFSESVGGVHGGSRVVAHIERLAGYLNSTPPANTYWAPFGGSNFVFFAMGDRGACDGPPSLWNIIVASDYGHTGLRDSGGDRWVVPPCMVSHRGVVMPPTAPGHQAGIAAATYGNTPGGGATVSAPQWRRHTFFFFAGTLMRGDKDGYAGGVRWRVADAWANVSDAFVIDTRNPEGGRQALSQDAMFAAMRNSTFCLAPSGHGFGVRLTYAMLTGCVPVIIADGIRQPLDDVLPYWRFSVRMARDDIPAMQAILRAIPPARVAALQAGVARYHTFFVWCVTQPACAAAGQGAAAYEGVLESLRRKLYNAHARLPR
jgi:hypothetical protein